MVLHKDIDYSSPMRPTIMTNSSIIKVIQKIMLNLRANQGLMFNLMLCTIAIALFLLSRVETERNLIIYSFSANNPDSNAYSNLKFFLQNGMNCPNSEYHIIVNGHTNLLIEHPKLTIHKRENAGMDFGAISYIVKKLPIFDFKYVFIINDSVRGPYIPNYVKYWTDAFINTFDAETAIVTTTFSCELIPHGQSMMYVVQRKYFEEYLKFINKDFGSMRKDEIIIQGEVGMTKYFTTRNIKVKSMMVSYRHMDSKVIQHCNDDINPFVLGHYFGGSLHPLEVIFLKHGKVDDSNIEQLKFYDKIMSGSK